MPIRVVWTRQAREDLRAIREHIARNAPATAVAFVNRIRNSVDRLSLFPETGQIVAELDRDDIREILRGPYRIIYRIAKDRCEILTVYHSARLLDDSSL